MPNSQLCGWDITMSAALNEKSTVLKFADSLFKRWAFQLEKGKEDGYLHWQFRGSLETKKRKGELIKMMREGGIVIADNAVKPSAKITFTSCDEEYVMKEDTRVEGPWSSKDVVAYIPIDMRATPDWRPWQAECIETMAVKPNRRHIHCFVDTSGNIGKSFLAMWLHCHGKAFYVPCFTEAKELMRMSTGMLKSGWRDTFFIDLPRALSHKSENEIYGGIEQLKTGMIYEDRYEFRMQAIDPVHVFIFTNRVPNMKLVSPDRWIIKHFNGENFREILSEGPPGADAVIAKSPE